MISLAAVLMWTTAPHADAADGDDGNCVNEKAETKCLSVCGKHTRFSWPSDMTVKPFGKMNE